MRARICLAGFVVLCGCAHSPHLAPITSAPSRANDYVDLEAGWRLRVITPVLKSGGTVVKLVKEPAPKESASGLGITLRAPDDLAGYETAYYSVLPKRGSGVKIKFVSAELHRDQDVIPERHSRMPLFQLPRDARHVRLVYLIRRSTQADHNMAVIATNQKEDLDALTRAVQADPNACATQHGRYCSWVPEGVAVRPLTPSEALP